MKTTILAALEKPPYPLQQHLLLPQSIRLPWHHKAQASSVFMLELGATVYVGREDDSRKGCY